MNKATTATGLIVLAIGIGLMVYSAYPLYQANYATQYNSLGERFNGTDPYLHPELGEASWALLFSGFPLCFGLLFTVMGLVGVSFLDFSFNSDNKTKGET